MLGLELNHVSKIKITSNTQGSRAISRHSSDQTIKHVSLKIFLAISDFVEYILVGSIVWQHQAITWTNVDLSILVKFFSIHLRAISHCECPSYYSV